MAKLIKLLLGCAYRLLFTVYICRATTVVPEKSYSSEKNCLVHKISTKHPRYLPQVVIKFCAAASLYKPVISEKNPPCLSNPCTKTKNEQILKYDLRLCVPARLCKSIKAELLTEKLVPLNKTVGFPNKKGSLGRKATE